MHHPVAVGGGADQARFGIADVELPVVGGPVLKTAQLALQPQKLSLQVGVEGQHIRAMALAPLGLTGGRMEMAEAGEARVEVAEGWLHGWEASQPVCWRPMDASSRLACS